MRSKEAAYNAGVAYALKTAGLDLRSLLSLGKPLESAAFGAGAGAGIGAGIGALSAEEGERLESAMRGLATGALIGAGAGAAGGAAFGPSGLSTLAAAHRLGRDLPPLQQALALTPMVGGTALGAAGGGAAGYGLARLLGLAGGGE